MRRSMLFLPGNNPAMLTNGDSLKADSVIMDLEDATAPSEKDAARILVRNALRNIKYRGCEIIVRINSLDTDYWKADLDMVLPCRPDIIMPTKVSSGNYIRTLSEYMASVEKKAGMEEGSTKLMPLLETALGIENAFEIAASSPRIVALYLGAEDLTADLRCKRTEKGDEIFYSRSRLVCAARAAGLDAYDTPYLGIDNLEGLRVDTELAKSLGFTGKAAISPRHVGCINEVFSPTHADIQYARSVFEALRIAKEQGIGVITLNGKMIDAPIVLRARQVLEMADAISGGAKK